MCDAKMGFLKKLEGHLVAPKADTSLQLADQYAVLGDNLEGTLTVSPHEAFRQKRSDAKSNAWKTFKLLKANTTLQSKAWSLGK